MSVCTSLLSILYAGSKFPRLLLCLGGGILIPHSRHSRVSLARHSLPSSWLLHRQSSLGCCIVSLLLAAASSVFSWLLHRQSSLVRLRGCRFRKLRDYGDQLTTLPHCVAFGTTARHMGTN
jgi:hypothetical protein